MFSFFSVIDNVKKYRGLVKQLVFRDIKLKYRRSLLGYVWSILNPLMIMMVLTIVFSNFFRFEIKNFPVYLLSGQVIFNSFSSCTTASCFTILENGALIRKTYVPKYLFIISKVTSCFVDFLFSLAALFLVMLITRTRLSIYNLQFFVPVVEIYIFSIGVGLFVSQANVFFRDVHYIYSVIITAMSYLTPLFYPIDVLPDNVKFFVVNYNPLYIFVDSFRTCVYSCALLDKQQLLKGFIWAFSSVLVGGIFFKKNQDKFILYI